MAGPAKGTGQGPAARPPIRKEVAPLPSGPHHTPQPAPCRDPQPIAPPPAPAAGAPARPAPYPDQRHAHGTDRGRGSPHCGGDLHHPERAPAAPCRHRGRSADGRRASREDHPAAADHAPRRRQPHAGQPADICHAPPTSPRTSRITLTKESVMASSPGSSSAWLQAGLLAKYGDPRKKITRPDPHLPYRHRRGAGRRLGRHQALPHPLPAGIL